MHNWLSYADKHQITLLNSSACQFCGAPVSKGVRECHDNVHRIAELLDFNDPANYVTRFLSVDALALQHYEVHGMWNNYIHFSRLILIFEKNVAWNYTLTPVLSNVVNDFKRNREPVAVAPVVGQRGTLTTVDLLRAETPEECREIVKEWGQSVYQAFYSYRDEVEPIIKGFLQKR